MAANELSREFGLLAEKHLLEGHSVDDVGLCLFLLSLDLLGSFRFDCLERALLLLLKLFFQLFSFFIFISISLPLTFFTKFD